MQKLLFETKQIWLCCWLLFNLAVSHVYFISLVYRVSAH